MKIYIWLSERRLVMKKAFTLIELITVVVIIAILVSLALPQYTRLIERGQGSAAMSCLDSIRKAETLYFSLYYIYTTTTAYLATEVPEITKLSNADWAYGLTVADTSVFTATANRLRGKYEDYYVRLSNDGVLDGSHPSVTNLW